MARGNKTQRNNNGTLTVAGDPLKKRPTGVRLVVTLDPASSNKVEAKLARLFAVVDSPSFFVREILLLGAQSATDLINSKIEQLGGIDETSIAPSFDRLQSNSAALPQRTELTAMAAGKAARSVPPLNFGSTPKSAADA